VITSKRRLALAVASSALPLTLVGCGALGGSGSSASAGPSKGDDVRVGLLLPETENKRYEKFDYPIIKEKVSELTHKQGVVEYANARSSKTRQAAQMRKMIDEKVDVILLDAVDAHAIAGEVQKAKDAGIPVIAYDRLAEGPIDAYISFDNELVGEVQGRTLLEALDSSGGGRPRIVMMNGSPTDPNASQFKKAALSQLDGKVTVARSYDTKDWKPVNARANMAKAIQQLGVSGIDGVYSANDGMAGGVIKAFKDLGVTQLPPITGQDADLEAVQRIVTGEQYMSVYKPYPTEAENAAQMAIAKVQGRDIEFDSLARDTVDSPTQKNIPAQLVSVVALTKKNIKSTVVADGIYKISEICTAAYQPACAAAGLL